MKVDPTYTLTLSLRELKFLWHRLNMSDTAFEDCYTSSPEVLKDFQEGLTDSWDLWEQLDNLLRKTGHKIGE